ncbi:MAG: TetR family transcriptional regulator [Chloroflexi bacterium]|nr:TetR family transcriptional regulator [Chloroflexota bacterium]
MTHVYVPSELADLPDTVRHRRLPSQARSRERVQRLLDTADALIGSDGFGALTIPLLASTARMPVGSIYQFFPDKSAIVDAVAARYMQLFLDELEQLTDRIVKLRWDSAVDTVIEHFAGMYRNHPTFCELWLNSHLTPGARERDRRNNDDLAAMLVEQLKHRPEFAHTASRRLTLACRTAVEVADGLLRYAFSVDASGDQPTLNELKRILSSYLLNYAAAGRPSTPRRSPASPRSGRPGRPRVADPVGTAR